MFKSVVNCFLLVMFLFSLTSQPVWSLPPEIEADRYLLAAMNKIDTKDYSGAITYFDKIIALKVPLPNDLFYHYGKVLGQTGDHKGSYKQLETYLGKAGRSGKYYMEALQGLTDAEQAIEKAEKQAKIAAEKAREKARRQAKDAADRARAKAKKYVSEGNSLKGKGKCKEAIVSYSKALEISLDPEVLDKRGQCYTHYSMKPKEYSKAIEDFSKAIAIYPDKASYYYNRGKSLYYTKDYSKAVEDFNEAIKRNSGDASMYKWRGWARQALKEYDKAIGDFTKVIEMQPEEDNHYIYGNRAQCWEGKGELDKAMVDRDMAIAKYTGKYDSTRSWLYKYRGDLWKKKKDFDKALADFDTAIRLDNDSTSPLIARANLLIDEKREYDKAIKDYSKVLGISPTNSTAFFNRGLAWWKKKDWAKAVVDFTDSIKHDPKYVRAYSMRGRSRNSLKDWSNAIDDFNKAIALESDKSKHYRYYIYRGIAFAGQNKKDKAIASYTKAIDLHPTWTWAYDERGGELLDKGEIDLALADFFKIIELSSSYPGYKFSDEVRTLETKNAHDAAITLWTKLIEKWPLADNYRRRAGTREDANDRRGALVDYTKAIEVDPDVQSRYVSRARCYRRLGEADNALADYDRALKLEGDSGSTLSALKDKATLLLDMGRKEEAQETYRLAILESERDVKSNSDNEYLDYDFSQRAYLRYTFEDYTGVVADLNSAIEINPRWYYYKRKAAVLWKKLGEYSQALEVFAKLQEVKPDNDSGLAGPGIVLYRQGKYRKARKSLQEAIALKPDSVEINNALAFFYASCPKKSYRDPLKAIEYAKVAAGSGKELHYLYETLALAYATGEQFGEAVEAQQKAVNLYEQKTPWNINEAKLLLGKMEERLSSYQANRLWEGEGHPLDWR